MQEDALEGVLSVRENLQYSALLRLPEDMTRQEKYDRVEEVAINNLYFFPSNFSFFL
jgi:ABC-type multidrug transport system ATPase subunit